MTTQQAKVGQAEGRIRIARDRLAARYPFHVAILSRLRVTAEAGIGTMAVAQEGEDVLLFHEPEFVLGITIPELGGVLLHEVHHILFGHLTMSKKEYPNPAALIVAQEVTANEFISEPLPGEPVLLSHYPQLPPRESTAERYRRLEKIIPVTQVVLTMDNHGPWDNDSSAPDEIGAAVLQVVEDAVVEAGGAGGVPKELRDALEALTGHLSNDAEEKVTRGTRGHLPWQRLLRRYSGQVLQVRPVFTRPPRRFSDMVGIIPGQGRLPARPKVMSVIDTSGSITADLLTQIDAELSRLARSYEVTVVECDCRIQRVYPYQSLNVVWGRGGTDLRPPLQRDFLRTHRPDLVIYFTDGFGPAPDRPPIVPVIWVVLPGGKSPATWGRSIHTGTANVRKM
jgi:predicted metal-dependent peptidase